MSEGATGRKRFSRNVADLEMRIQALTLELTRTHEAFQSAIAERNRAEEELRIRKAQRAAEELRLFQAEKMVSLGILISGIAHEINNPNNYVLLNSKIISRVWNDARAILDEHYEKAGEFVLGGMSYSEERQNIDQLVSGITEGSQRIHKIVLGIKDFARRNTGSFSPVVDANAVIQSAFVIMKSFIYRSTDSFSAEYGHDLPPIEGNAQQLEQVVINLISNACEALRSKKGKVSISTRFVEEVGHIKIEIQDDGVGIAPENLKSIIDPFFTTKRSTGGLGLGLSTSHAIVRNHGGELTFASQPGKGTIATVVLPLSQIVRQRLADAA